MPGASDQVGRSVYGTQFHPEIDSIGVDLRLNYYGGVYFAAGIIERVRARQLRTIIRRVPL